MIIAEGRLTDAGNRKVAIALKELSLTYESIYFHFRKGERNRRSIPKRLHSDNYRPYELRLRLVVCILDV